MIIPQYFTAHIGCKFNIERVVGKDNKSLDINPKE